MDSQLTSLKASCSVWIETGDERPLGSWLARELSADGSPSSLPPEDWAPCLEWLGNARSLRDGLSVGLASRVDAFFAWLVHVSRPDGSAVFGPTVKDRGRIATLVQGASRDHRAATATVVARWFPGSPIPQETPAPPPLPAISVEDRPLAMLRPDWNADGDWLAIDQRSRDDTARLEVAGSGRPWILGGWHSEGRVAPDRVGGARPTSWSTGPLADCLEWTFRVGATRVTRTAVLLRYRKTVLLAQQEEGPAPGSGFRVPLALGVTAVPAAEARLLTLMRGRASARLIPLALPCSPHPSDRGSLEVVGDEAVLRQASSGRRAWFPMVLTWGKPPTSWRTLTVTERSKVCPPGVAFAARLSWGVGADGLLVYRSMNGPALRTVLGLQTRARFLIGRFTPDGNVVPLLSLD